MQSFCKVILILYFLRKHFFRREQKRAWGGIGSFPVLLGAVMAVKNNLELWVHPVQRQQQQLWSSLASLCQLRSLCAGEEIMKGAPESRQCCSAVPGLLWGRPYTQLSAGLAAPAPGLEGTQRACLRWGFLVSATWDQGSNASFFLFCCCSIAKLCQTLWPPWTAACQAPLSFAISWSLLNSCPLSWWCYPTISSSVIHFSCLQSFQTSGSFPMSQPFTSGGQKYWSFSISPSDEDSGLISFRIDWFDLLIVQGTLKSLLQHHSSKASNSSVLRLLYGLTSHVYMTTGKTIAFIGT